MKRIVVLTGAGISQESGLPTFRGADGLWEGYRVEDVASASAFERHPELVQTFYNQRRRQLVSGNVQPNAAHRALAEWELQFPEGQFLLVTQNVDDLHERAGSRQLIHLHGELLKARCLDSGEVFPWTEDLTGQTPHPLHPERRGRLRPHIVWFGEEPFELDRIASAVAQCDMFMSVGTSGRVYPAADFVRWTSGQCHKVEINLEDTPVAHDFDETIRGPAAIEVPRFLQRW